MRRWKDIWQQNVQTWSTLGIELLDENQKVPLLYWISEQHKWPYKFCYTAGASEFYNKQIACYDKHIAANQSWALNGMKYISEFIIKYAETYRYSFLLERI